jgi:ribA/ribD-fused uncharacterized protein
MIFVFGSNLAGRHGKGAAKCALYSYGAIYGQGEGPQGNSYAIPTKDHALNSLPLERIKNGVDQFLSYARSHPYLQFQVTAIGTGLAGYKHEQIAPMFRGAPRNCSLPEEWREFMFNDPIYFQSKGAEEFRFLSNFYFSPIVHKFNRFLSSIAQEGDTYASVEHFYQALKATTREDHELVRLTGSPKEAKCMGSTIKLRSDWEDGAPCIDLSFKELVMLHGLRMKFNQHEDLKQKLLDTGDRDLIEYAPWGDTYWGVDKKKFGQNRLGKLLMTVRAGLRGC